MVTLPALFVLLMHLLGTNAHTMSQMFKSQRRRHAVFRKVFPGEYKLDITPMKTIEDTGTITDCINLCTQTKGCVSVNLNKGEDICELLAEDRRNHTTIESFQKKEHYEYYDTIVRDLCNENDTCYPYKCWSTAFYRSQCIRRGYKENNLDYFVPSGVVIHIRVDPTNLRVTGSNDANMLYRTNTDTTRGDLAGQGSWWRYDGMYCNRVHYSLHSLPYYCINGNNVVIGIEGYQETLDTVSMTDIFAFHRGHWLYIDASNKQLYEAKRTITCNQFYNSDATGGGEIYIGDYENRDDCAIACIESSQYLKPQINGATYDHGNKRCYCEYRQTSQPSSTVFVNCKFAETTAREKVASGDIKRIQYHDGYWYAIGISCKCILKHDATSSPNENKWVEATTLSTDTVVEFKINFNGDLFAYHEDQSLKQWNFRKNMWQIFYSGTFLGFDVHHAVIMLNNNHLPYTELTYVPQPRIHIAFKYYNETGGYTPYGRGKDYAGNNRISLTDSSSNRVEKETYGISWDQFGKGKVLYKGNGRVTLGSVKPGSFTLSMEATATAGVTIGVWIRCFPQTFRPSTDTYIITNRWNGASAGVSIYLRIVNNQYTLTVTFLNDITRFRYYSNIPITDTQAYHYWTHIGVRKIHYGIVETFINGSFHSTFNSDHIGLPHGERIGEYFIDGPPIVVSDLVIYPLLLHKLQMESLVRNDRVPEMWNQEMFLPVTATSCNQLKEQRAYQASGMYWIVLNGVKVAVYCDMVTDAGGWTLVGYYDTKHSNHQTASTYDQIGEAVFGGYGIDTSALRSLKSATFFQQIRFRCQKESHNRVVDIATSSTDALDYFIGASSTTPSSCGGAYYTLEDHTAILGKDCTKTKLNSNVINHPFSIDSVRGMTSAGMCDDLVVYESVSYKIFVR